MFISEEVARERLNSSKNVLTVIDKEGAREVGVPHEREPEVIIPEVLPEDTTCQSAIGVILAPPDMSLIRRMLGVKAPGGRKIGDRNLDMETRAAVATCAELTNETKAASVFEVSQAHANSLKHGYMTTNLDERGDGPDKDLTKIINRQKTEVRNLAFEKLTKTLGLISDDKLMALTDPTKLGRLAKDLSGVVDKVLPKEAAVLGGVHFHVWRPEMRDEATYDTVTVGNGQ